MIDLESAVLGLEFGSTRIKAVLIGPDHEPLASGSHAWENRLEDGVWVYSLEDVHRGLRQCYRSLAEDVREKYGLSLRRVAAIGISGMMHGYLVFDREGRQLAPFRTWRNTITGPAARALTEALRFNIPQRWSAAHIYQAILNGEEHIPRVACLTTLSGYIHRRLTGENVVGVGEASGMFPYDQAAGDFDRERLAIFDSLAAARGVPWKLRDILPRVLPAGESAGVLTAEGAAFLDETGTLEPGIPLCPPEGDAGTGMTATGCVLPRTGSVSAGTSAFALLVLEHDLAGCYPEIDVIATPTGRAVAMAHANTCTSDADAWIRLLAEAIGAAGGSADMDALYPLLYRKALEGEPDCGGLLCYNFFSGEPVAAAETGRPMLLRLPGSPLTLPNFMRAQLYGAVATLRLGMDLLAEKEQVRIDRLVGHGGFFKTPGVGAQILSDALGKPVSTLETAGEGGPWGMALLAAYMVRRAPGETLEDYLTDRVFAKAPGTVCRPDPAGAAGYQRYMERYRACLPAERAAAALQ